MSNIFSRKRFGLILRSFSSKLELVEKQVSAVLETIKIASSIFMEGKQLFSRIDVLVSADAQYEDSDCGLTAQALRTALASETSVFVSEVKHGDIFCGLLNYGIAHQLRDRIDYSLILSTQTRSYLNVETLTEIINSVEKGAKVVGIALEELTESISKGCIANTFALWDNVSLMTVGGFDLRASKPKKNNPLTRYLQGWSEEKGEVYYHFAGVEEIIPLIRLVRIFGKCIGVVLPQGENAKKWIAPNPKDDPEGYVRHLKKMGTKMQRQTAFAAMENADLSLLQGGVIPK